MLDDVFIQLAAVDMNTVVTSLFAVPLTFIIIFVVSVSSWIISCSQIGIHQAEAADGRHGILVKHQDVLVRVFGPHHHDI